MNLYADIERIKNCSFHDYELKDIIVSYYKSAIEIYLKSPIGENTKLDINEFNLFRINHDEEWGSGIYITAAIVKIENKKYRIEIELNSGDLVEIEGRYHL